MLPVMSLAKDVTHAKSRKDVAFVKKFIRISFYALFVIICLAISYFGIRLPWFVRIAIAAIPIWLPKRIIKLYEKRKENEALEEYYNAHPEERR